MYKHVVKPFFDILISSIVLVVLSPILLLATLILTILNNGKPFFVQERPGRNEKIFKLIKFKTMTDRRSASGELLPDADRLTLFGAFLRKLSIDEIPQFINVVKGDMSIVGPRPLLVEYLERYNEFQKRRHEVKPGITGWAQVNGRNAISWEKKFEYDVSYIDNLSFGLDVKIIFLTIKKVIFREGVNKNSQETMDLFRGNN